MKHRIYIVEDHPVMREGYASLISRAADLELVGEATTGIEALERVPSARPDLVMVDLSLPGVDGLEVIKRLRALDGKLRFLVVSAHSESLYADRALRAGAHGFVMKHEPPETIVDAVRQVLQGQTYLSDAMRERAVERDSEDGEAVSPVERLSDRELEVFRHLGEGLTTREIADALFVSPKTVETHRENIKRKLGLKNAAELIQRATLWVQSLA